MIYADNAATTKLDLDAFNAMPLSLIRLPKHQKRRLKTQGKV